MNIRKLLLAVTVFAAAMLSFAACGGSGSDQDSSSSDEFVIGHTYPDLQNPYYVSLKDATEPLMQELGYRYIATDSTQDPAKQLTDIENLISRGVDILFIDAVDPKAIVPGVQAANQADIPVVALVRVPKGGEWKSLVYLDHVKHGQISCQYIVDELNGNGNVAELQGIMATNSGSERSKGCNKALSAAPGIDRIAQQEADFARPQALDAMENIIEANRGKIDGVFAANDAMILGAIEAFKSAGIDPADKVTVGIDGTSEALKAICDGELDATMATPAANEAKIIARLAKKIRNDKKVPNRIEFKGIFTTQENVKEVIKTSEFNDIKCEL